MGGASTSGKTKGPHVEKRLNHAFVKKALPGRHTDGGGLYLVVDKSGARRWLLRITVKGVRRDFGLGSAKLIGLAEARDKAFEYRKLAAAGRDPKRALAGNESSMLFRTAAQTYHEEVMVPSSRNGKHVNQWINTLKTYAFPSIGEMYVSDVTSNDLLKVLKPIWLEKPETARRVLQRMQVVFDWAITGEYRAKANPTKGIKTRLPTQRDKVKHFNAIKWEDADKLMRQLERTEGIGAKALRFTILTVSRTRPVRLATWSQFSSGFETWTVPAANMKADEAFIVPLPESVRELLFEMRANAHRASDFVFQSPSKPQQAICENTMLKNLKKFHPNATVHGMRSAFRDWAELFADAPRAVKETVLAHKNANKVESAYLRTKYFHQREELMEIWARYFLGAEGTFEQIRQQYWDEKFDPSNFVELEDGTLHGN